MLRPLAHDHDKLAGLLRCRRTLWLCCLNKTGISQMELNSSLLGLLLGVVWISLSYGARGDGVNQPREPEVHQPQTSVKVLPGEDCTLRCEVTSIYPGPVKWFMGQGPTRKLIYSQSNPRNRGTRTAPSSLTNFNIFIRNISHDDVGTYYCVKLRREPGAEDKDWKSGPGTEVVIKSSRENIVIPVAAGTLCILLTVLLFIAVYLYIKQKRGENSSASRPEDALSEKKRTPNQTLPDKEIVYADVNHPSSPRRPKQSKSEECSEYATIRVA